jgi:hypothetical protein
MVAAALLKIDAIAFCEEALFGLIVSENEGGSPLRAEDQVPLVARSHPARTQIQP